MSRTICVPPCPPLWVTEWFCWRNFTIEGISRTIIDAKWSQKLFQPRFVVASSTVVYWKPGVIVSSQWVLHVDFLKNLIKNLFYGCEKSVPVIVCQNRQNPLTRCFHLHSFFHFSSYQFLKFSKFHQVVDNSFLREFASTFDVLPLIGSKVLAKQMFVENRKFDKHQQFDRH